MQFQQALGEPEVTVGILHSITGTMAISETGAQEAEKLAIAQINEAGGVAFGRNLWVRQPDGVWMLVQIWDARGWTERDFTEFADGIHVLPGAQRGHG